MSFSMKATITYTVEKLDDGLHSKIIVKNSLNNTEDKLGPIPNILVDEVLHEMKETLTARAQKMKERFNNI